MKTLIVCISILSTICSYAASQNSFVDVTTTIPANCAFSNVSPQIILSEKGDVSTGSFILQCNTTFALKLSTKSLLEGRGETAVKSANGTWLKTLISVRFANNLYVLDGVKSVQNHNPVNAERGVVNVKLAEPIQNTNPAGVYQDILYLDVTF